MEIKFEEVARNLGVSVFGLAQLQRLTLYVQGIGLVVSDPQCIGAGSGLMLVIHGNKAEYNLMFDPPPYGVSLLVQGLDDATNSNLQTLVADKQPDDPLTWEIVRLVFERIEGRLPESQ
jgi:hypothetical protein